MSYVKLVFTCERCRKEGMRQVLFSYCYDHKLIDLLPEGWGYVQVQGFGKLTCMLCEGCRNWFDRTVSKECRTRKSKEE